MYFGALLPEDFYRTEETDFLKYLKRDLNLLLKMPFNHFVSHVIMDENLKKTLFSFMLYAPRVYDEKRRRTISVWLLEPSPAIGPIYANILRVYYRLITDDIGYNDFLKTKPPYGGFGVSAMEAFFKTNTLSIETLVDLCSIFGVNNRGILSHMLDKVAERRPFFRDDVIGFLNLTMKKMEEITARLLDAKKEGVRAKKEEEEYALFLNDIVWNLCILHQRPTMCNLPRCLSNSKLSNKNLIWNL